MRRSVEDINRFYATPEGRVARTMVMNKFCEAWPDVRGLDMVAIGYASPFLEPFVEARRVLQAMPAGQGAEIWPDGLKVRTTLVEDAALPFPTSSFDRVILIHALEEAQNPHGLLAEAARILSPSGRLIIVAAARGGMWAHADHTPVGHGQPYSRSQLESAVREADLEPRAWSYALHVPPIRAMIRWARWFESLVPKIAPLSGGVIMMEAGRKPFIALRQPAESSLLARWQAALSPRPVPSAPLVRLPDRG